MPEQDELTSFVLPSINTIIVKLLCRPVSNNNGFDIITPYPVSPLIFKIINLKYNKYEGLLLNAKKILQNSLNLVFTQ